MVLQLDDDSTVELDLHRNFTSLRRLGRVSIINFEAYFRVPDDSKDVPLHVDSLTGKITCGLSTRNNSGQPSEIIIRRKGWTEYETDRAATGMAVALVPGPTISSLTLTDEAKELGWKQHGKDLFCPQDMAGGDSDIRILSGAVSILQRGAPQQQAEITLLKERLDELEQFCSASDKHVASVETELKECKLAEKFLEAKMVKLEATVGGSGSDVDELRGTILEVTQEVDSLGTSVYNASKETKAKVVACEATVDGMSCRVEECSAKVDWMRTELERMTPIAEEGCTKANIKCWSRSSELASIEHQKVEKQQLLSMIMGIDQRHQTSMKAMQAENEALKRDLRTLSLKMVG